MQEKNILLCFLALPLRHKLVAAVIAVAISSGLLVWSRHSAARSSMTAEMLFDTTQAQQIDPGLSSTKEPAVALGHSILNDDTINGLMKRVGLHADVAQFRSHLEMTQQSPKSLNVKYQDGDKKLSAAAANAVANLLVAWRPPSDVTGAKPLPAQQASTAAHPAETSRHGKHSSRRQSTQIRNLEAQLAATEQRLAALNSPPPAQSAPRKTYRPKQMSSADDERHALEMQLNADQKRLDNLRARYTDLYPDVENVKEDIAQIQQKLASIQSADNEEKQAAIHMPSDAGSNEINHLRLERARLLEAIAVEKRHKSTLQDQATAAGSLSPPVQSPTLSPPQPATVPQLGNPASPLTLQSPFTLVRLASYNESVSWWRGLLAGILCGLLYLAVAMRRYQPIGSSAAPSPVVPSNNSGAEPVNNFTDLQGWVKKLKQELALTDIGRQEEDIAAREQALVGQQLDRGSGPKQQLLQQEEVLQAIKEKVKQDPDSWMAHTEEARTALAGGDYNTAIREINLAITVAPEGLKPKLDRIIMLLNRNAQHS